MNRMDIGVGRVMIGGVVLVIIAISYITKYPEFVYVPWALRGARGYPPQYVMGTSTKPSAKDYIRARLKQQFPVGSSESRLIRSLWIYRFTVHPERIGSGDRVFHNATLEGSMFVCALDWSVTWSADDGIITSTDGDLWVSCL